MIFITHSLIFCVYIKAKIVQQKKTTKKSFKQTNWHHLFRRIDTHTKQPSLISRYSMFYQDVWCFKIKPGINSPVLFSCFVILFFLPSSLRYNLPTVHRYFLSLTLKLKVIEPIFYFLANFEQTMHFCGIKASNI